MTMDNGNLFGDSDKKNDEQQYADVDETKFPHLTFLSENNIEPNDSRLPAYLKTRLVSWIKTREDLENFEGTKEEREEIVTTLQKSSLDIVDDLEEEFGGNAKDFIDIQALTYPHQEYVKEYNIRKDELPDNIVLLIKNFDSLYVHINSTVYGSPDEQEVEVNKLRKMSRDIKIALSKYYDKKQRE